MMTSMFSATGTKNTGTKNGVMILIPTIQKHPETRFGVIHFHPKENLKEETLALCHSLVREKTTQKLKWNFRNN